MTTDDMIRTLEGAARICAHRGKDRQRGLRERVSYAIAEKVLQQLAREHREAQARKDWRDSLQPPRRHEAHRPDELCNLSPCPDAVRRSDPARVLAENTFYEPGPDFDPTKPRLADLRRLGGHECGTGCPIHPGAERP